MFAFGAQFARMGLRNADPTTGAFLGIGAATLLFWLFSPLFIESAYWLAPAVILLAAVGLLRPFLSTRMHLAGTQRLGPTISTTLESTSPIFALVLGAALLHETLTPTILLGTAGVVAGGIVLSWKGRLPRAWPLWALVLPIGAAAFRAIAHFCAKLGMETIPSPFFAALLSYTVAAAIAFWTLPKTFDRTVIQRPEGRWLALAGAVNGTAVGILNMALQHGKLIVVAPIVSTVPMFSLVSGPAAVRRGNDHRAGNHRRWPGRAERRLGHTFALVTTAHHAVRHLAKH